MQLRTTCPLKLFCGVMARWYAEGEPLATIADATLTGDHLVFWVASAVFLCSAVVAALLFRSGPLPVNQDAEPVIAH